jgi:putative chitinase
MLTLTPDLLQRATGCARGIALTWAKPLADACEAYEIDTPARVAAFLAQTGHESDGFTRTVENLHYSAPRIRELATASPPGSRWHSLLGREAELSQNPAGLAEAVYGGRMGNSQPGDGYRFRGRGVLMNTGRANYEAVRDLLREKVSSTPDLIAMPEVLAEPKWAALAAAAFWHDHDLNVLADVGAFDTITKRVNGGMVGANDRRARYAKARGALA